jgi:hypothetical protein
MAKFLTVYFFTAVFTFSVMAPSCFNILNIDIDEIVWIDITEEEPKSETDKLEEDPKLVFEEDANLKRGNKKKNLTSFTFYKDIFSTNTIQIDLPPPEYFS